MTETAAVPKITPAMRKALKAVATDPTAPMLSVMTKAAFNSMWSNGWIVTVNGEWRLNDQMATVARSL